MNPETGSRHQTAVLWEQSGYDSNGQPTVGYPEEIECRWEDVTRQIMGEQDTPIAISAEVWVDVSVAKGSMLWKGALIDLPDTVTAVMEVVGYDETPDIKGRVFERVLYLQRYREALPTVV